MIGDADADGLALRVLQAARGLTRGFQQKCVGPRGGGFEQPKLPGVDACVAGDFTEVAAHQCEMMVPIGPAQAPQALQRPLVPQMSPQGIAAVGRIGDQAALAHDLGRLADQAQLRVFGV